MDSDKKVQEIFRELAGERTERLKGDVSLSDSIDCVAAALQDGSHREADILRAQEIGFHLMDWQSEAAFLVAVALFPERFTAEEIRQGVDRALIHAPYHILEAARQGGYPTVNIFIQKK